MRGEWKQVWNQAYAFTAPDGSVHARCFLSDRDETRPWLVYTEHTEGNDCFATLEEAQRHGERRLQDLLSATEALRDEK